MVQPLSRRSFVIFLSILAVYLAVSLYRLNDVPPPWYDEIVHLNASQHFADEGRLTCDFYKHRFKEGVLFNGMPLHWLLLGCYGKAFGFDFFTARLFYLLLSAVTLLCVYLLSGKMFGGRIAVNSTLALAASFVFFHNSRQIIPQVPAAAFSALTILMFYLSGWRNSRPLLALSGLAAGLAGLSHPIGFIASFAIIALLIRSRARMSSYILYLSPLVLTLAPYLIYVAINYPEYLNQTRAVVKEMYVNQPAVLNILDDLPVRYFGLPRISLALSNRYIDGRQINSLVYEFMWRVRHLDLRIWLCEMVRSVIFLFPVLYLLLKKKISGRRKDMAIIAAVYIASMTLHPNKFAPYSYIVMPYFAICFTLFVREMAEKKKPVTAGLLIILFLISNPLFIIKELITRKIEPYRPFINKVSSYIKKGSVVAGPVYFWPGMHKDYVFVSINALTYEVDRLLRDKYGGVNFKDLPPGEQESIAREVLRRNRVEYLLMTTHHWEGLTEAPGLTRGLTEAMRHYLFHHAEKMADLLRDNFYADLPAPGYFEEEVYDQRMGRPGFRNVNDEYQRSLKIYRLDLD